MRFIIFLALAGLALKTVAAGDRKIVCYFGSWSVYRPGAGLFSIEDIDSTLCTHYIYTFVGISGDNVKVLDPWQDLPEDWGKDGFGRFNNLRKRNPSVKTLVAIGGWNEGSLKYSAMAADPSTRSSFVKNAVAFVKKHNFDGFDLDWEYPAQREGKPYDVNNFAALVREMREAFDKEGLLLSAAVAAAESSASQSYNIAEISKYLHFINIMAYDFHGSWESSTGLNAPLFAGSSDTGNNAKLTVDAAIKYWISQGANPKKLILGTPLYGRAFTLADPSVTRIGAATTGPGTAGPYTREAGMLGYNEICELQNNEEWTIEFDEERRAPFAYRGNQWVGYDNVKSMKEKAEYVKKMELGGAMVWSIETDDFRGNCGDKYPLLNTLNAILRKGYQSVSAKPILTSEPTRKTTPYPYKSTSTSRLPNKTDEPIYDDTGSQICSEPGDFPDPNNTTRFFKCVYGVNGKLQAEPFACPTGTCYRTDLGICDWPQN